MACGILRAEPDLNREILPVGSTVTKERLIMPRLRKAKSVLVSGRSMVETMVSDGDDVDLIETLVSGVKVVLVFFCVME